MRSAAGFFGNVFSKLRKSFIISSAAAAVTFYVCFAISTATGNEQEIKVVFAFMLMIQTIVFSICAISSVNTSFHKYDQDIIGNAFVGITRKCRMFAGALDLLFDHKPNAALGSFNQLSEEYEDRFNQKEKALVCFYTGRCYEVMGFFPNALKYYQDSEKLGLDCDLLPLLIARCTGSNGDTGEAVQLYSSILGNTKSPYRLLVRTELGKMFLRENDAHTAMKWFGEAIDRRQNYADALGGAAIAQAMLHHFKESEELYRSAILNRISDPKGFTAYYKEVQAAALLESHTEQAKNNNN